jgi:ATP-dependent Lon protease
MRDDNHRNDPEPGFKMLERGFDSRLNRVQLLVPIDLHETLKAEEAYQALQEELDRQRPDKEADLEEPTEARSRKPTGSPAPPKTYEQQQKEADAAKERADAWAQKALWDRHAVTSARKGSRGPRYPVFQPEQALALHRRIRLYHKEDCDRFQRAYDEIAGRGHLRNIAMPSAAALQRLADTQPHMAPIVVFVQDQVELAGRACKPLRIPPILLVGEAGVGKTFFAQGLASALCAPISIQRLDTDLTSSVMLGSDRKWSTSQHGLLLELLALGKAANPVILLDEIDKVNRVDQRVQAGLYSLLEPVSARQVRDISLDFELDASLVTWLATANDAGRLDAPLRSRFKEFHIQVPTAEQCLMIAVEVIHATIRNAAVPGLSEETGRLERDLAHLTARQIQQATREAIARALKAGRTRLARQDLPAWVLGRDESPNEYLH